MQKRGCVREQSVLASLLPLNSESFRVPPTQNLLDLRPLHLLIFRAPPLPLLLIPLLLSLLLLLLPHLFPVVLSLFFLHFPSEFPRLYHRLYAFEGMNLQRRRSSPPVTHLLNTALISILEQLLELPPRLTKAAVSACTVCLCIRIITRVLLTLAGLLF